MTVAPPAPQLRSVSVIRATDLPAARAGGWCLIAAALAFVSVFSYLAVRFEYPAVLDGDAASVLPRLLALGPVGRAAWAVYAMIPLLLIPGAAGARAVLGERSPGAMRAALLFAAIAALSMTLGLARWPSIHWQLAHAYADAAPDARTAIGAVFEGLNAYLGQYIGEFLGEMCLNAFFVLSGFAALRSPGVPPWTGYAGVAAGVVGIIAAFRNVTTLVAPIADLNNYFLPLWLLAFGAVLVRSRGAASGR